MGAHCPTKSASLSRPLTFKVREVAIEPSASQRKVSDGSLAVCSSMDLARKPSRWSVAETREGVDVIMLPIRAETQGRWNFFATPERSAQRTLPPRTGGQRHRDQETREEESDRSGEETEAAVMMEQNRLDEEKPQRAQEHEGDRDYQDEAGAGIPESRKHGGREDSKVADDAERSDRDRPRCA